MTPQAAFLTGLAKVISTMTLYETGHPAQERAIDDVYANLVDLQEQSPTASAASSER